MSAGPSATAPSSRRVRGGSPLTGSVRTPGDKSVSHRALLVGALAEGTSTVRGLSDGDDVVRTRAAVSALGAAIAGDGGMVEIAGGRSRLHQAPAPLDCGNSATALRLLAGVVAQAGWRTVLEGDRSLSSRPMDRIAVPLRAMGARVEGQGDTCRPPLVVHGGGLRGIEWSTPVASAQVKSAVLLAALAAGGETIVREAVRTRTHTEELLALAGADIEVVDSDQGREVRLRPSTLQPFDLTVPGDPSQAAFWAVAGAIVPESTVVVENVYAGEERIGYVRVLQRMGADVELRPVSSATADVVATYGTLTATVVESAEIPSLDEVPALAVAAAAAEGTTVFRDVAELRVKEVDRLAATVEMVEAFGARAAVAGDELRIAGVGPGRRLSHGRVDSRGDHRMAMAAAVAGLAAGEGETVVDGADAVVTSYPRFWHDLAELAGSR